MVETYSTTYLYRVIKINIMEKLSKVDRLTKQLEVINARIQVAKNREEEKKKQHDTRRKILLGGYYLEQAAKNNSFADIQKIMESYLTKDIDRKLFDLPIIKSEEKIIVDKKEI